MRQESRTRGGADLEYLEQLVTFVNLFPGKGKFCLLALDRCYDKEGNLDKSNSKIYVPNEWVMQICQTDKDKFIPCISINPYKE